MQMYFTRFFLAVAAVLSVFLVTPLSVRAEAARAADAEAMHALTFADLKRIIPDFMEIYDETGWGMVDDVVIAGVPYSLVFLERDDSLVEWPDIKGDLPEKLHERSGESVPTDEQVYAYLQKLSATAASNFELLSAAAFAKNRDRLAKENPGMDDYDLRFLFDQNYEANRNATVAPEAQKARNEYEALIVLEDAMRLYIKRLKGNIQPRSP